MLQDKIIHPSFTTFYMRSKISNTSKDLKTQFRFYYLLLLFIGLHGLVTAQRPALNINDPEIGIVEHLGDFVPLDIQLINEHSETVLLGDILDKPTIINFVYFRCPGICSPMMSALGEAIDILDLKIGDDYQAFTISFDPSENTELGNKKKKNYIDLLEKQEAAKKGWHFFTGDSANMAMFTSITGFRYKKVGRDFNHTASLIVLSPKGKITRYIEPGKSQFDENFYFQPFDVKMSILDASEGKVRSTINKVLVFCYSYNPEGQQWVFNITKVSGILIGFMALVLFLILALKSKFRKQTTK